MVIIDQEWGARAKNARLPVTGFAGRYMGRGNMRRLSSAIHLISLILFLLNLCVYAFEDATVVFMQGNQVVLGDMRTKTRDTIYTRSGWGDPKLGGDGKTIALCNNKKILIINNDGTNPREYTPEQWPPDQNPYGKEWDYSTSGVYWPKADGNLYRFDPETAKTIVVKKSGPMDQRMSTSATGHRAYSGRNVVIEMSADFNSATTWQTSCIAGHGFIVTGGGKYVCTNSYAIKGAHHDYVDVSPFPTKGQSQDACLKERYHIDITHIFDNTPESEKPNPNSMSNWGSPHQVVNSDEWIMIRMGYHYTEEHQIRYAFVNIIDSSAVIIPFYNEDNKLRIAEGWIGPLPSPSSNSPYLTIDKTSLAFTAQSSPQNVTITNIGNQALGAVDITTTPSEISWLSYDIDGNGTNTVTITNTVDPSAVTDGEYSATVTISGGGAENSVSYSLTFINGSVLATPSELTATVGGDSMLDVSLAWKDNAQTEDGFAVEHKKEGGAWEEIGKTKADATTFTDMHLANGNWFYRVRAFAGSNYSGYSNEEKAYISGIPWVRISAPSTDSKILAGSTYAIKWTTNQVPNIEILYSTDDGLSWIPVTSEGGIVTTDTDWGNYAWKVPYIEKAGVLLKVQSYGDPSKADVAGPFAITSETIAGAHLRGASPGNGFTVDALKSGLIRIAVNTHGAHVVTLYDMRGAQIARRTGHGQAVYSLLNRLSNSLYVIRITRNHHTVSHPLIIK